MSGGEGEPKAGEPKAGGLMTSERVGPAFQDGVTWIEIGDKDREIGGSVARSFSQIFTCESDD